MEFNFKLVNIFRSQIATKRTEEKDVGLTSETSESPPRQSKDDHEKLARRGPSDTGDPIPDNESYRKTFNLMINPFTESQI